MPVTLQDIQWVVQENLTNTGDVDNLKAACNKAGVSYQPIKIIPFKDHLPEFDTSKSIFYGSTTLCGLVAADEKLHEGLFFDPDSYGKLFSAMGTLYVKFWSSSD